VVQAQAVSVPVWVDHLIARFVSDEGYTNIVSSYRLTPPCLFRFDRKEWFGHLLARRLRLRFTGEDSGTQV
jgi:hypothetical protein